MPRSIENAEQIRSCNGRETAVRFGGRSLGPPFSGRRGVLFAFDITRRRSRAGRIRSFPSGRLIEQYAFPPNLHQPSFPAFPAPSGPERRRTLVARTETKYINFRRANVVLYTHVLTTPVVERFNDTRVSYRVVRDNFE